MALLKESTMAKPITYKLQRDGADYHATYGGEIVGRVTRLTSRTGPQWEFAFGDDEERFGFESLAQIRRWLAWRLESRMSAFETVEFKRTVADACAKSPMRRSPLERAVVAMAFGAK
jgi:hypothetical protein